MSGGHKNPAGKIKLLLGCVFALVGVIMLVIAAVAFLTPGVPEEFIGTTEATVTRIDRYNKTTADNKIWLQTDVYIVYTVEGEEYENLHTSSNSSMFKGQKVPIYYDTRNPYMLITPGGKTIAGSILGSLGLVFLVAGIVVMRLRMRGVPQFTAFDDKRFDDELDLLERVANGEVEIVEKTNQGGK